MFKRFNKFMYCCTFLSIFVFSNLFYNSSLVYADNKFDSNPCADGVVLMDAKSGEILYSKNMNSPYPPASTTKIMTALLTLENCSDLEEIVTIDKKCESVDGSKIYLFQDEKISVKNLLYSLLLSSANDSAYALAEHVGGTFDNFITMMNTRAKELGCTNTNFVNPHGLYDDKHRTTPNDLALIMNELIKHEEYLTISGTKSYSIPPTNKCKDARPLWNGNKAIHEANSTYYKNCKASKTGYTIQSLHSYISYAKKDNQELIVALLHDKDKQFYTDSKKLFEFGFKNFETRKILSKGDEVTTYPLNDNTSISLISDKDIYVTMSKDLPNNDVLTVPSINLNDMNLDKRTIKKGDSIKEISVTYGDKKFPITLLSNTEHNPPVSIITTKSKSSWLKYVLISSMILLIIAVIARRNIIKNRKSRLNRYNRRKK